MLQIYKILGVNCLVTALTLSTLSIEGVKQGDSQMTSMGLVVAGLFFMISLARPLSTLSPSRPPTSVLCISALLSISLQFTVHLVFIFLTVSLSQPYIDPYSTATVPDAPFSPTPLNSAVFLVGSCVTINTFSVNYVGRPFTESMRENKLFFRSLIFCWFMLAVAATEVFLPLNQMLQLEAFPVPGNLGDIVRGEGGIKELALESGGLTGAVVGIMIADTVFVHAVGGLFN